MKKLITLVVLAIAVLTVQADELKVNYSFNRTNNTLNLSFPVKKGFNYSVVRYDIKNDWYDVYTNFDATVTCTNVCAVNPLVRSDVGQPTPSGQCYFYVVEQNWP